MVPQGKGYNGTDRGEHRISMVEPTVIYINTHSIKMHNRDAISCVVRCCRLSLFLF